jgi:hypothetical protein
MLKLVLQSIVAMPVVACGACSNAATSVGKAVIGQGTLTNKLGHDVVGGPNIKTAKELRGKKVGVQTLAGTVWMGAMLGLEHLGLEVERDGMTDMNFDSQPGTNHPLENFLSDYR